MTTKIFYFTGTGNTLFVAKHIAEKLGDAAIEPIAGAKQVIDSAVDAIGIFFPVCGWGMPKIVCDFVDGMENLQGKYIFAVCTYGGTLFASLKTTQARLRKKGFDLHAGFGIRMPVNYIPVFKVLSRQKENKLLEKAKVKIARIAEVIKKRQKSKIEVWKVPIINGLLLSMNGKMIHQLFEEDKKFRVNSDCNGCGVCQKVCPVLNITMKNDRPVWNHSCQQCLACLHWCPQAAIQYGKAPANRGRYHNPEVTLQEMMNQQGAPLS